MLENLIFCRGLREVYTWGTQKNSVEQVKCSYLGGVKDKSHSRSLEVSFSWWHKASDMVAMMAEDCRMLLLQVPFNSRCIFKVAMLTC